MKGFFRDNKGNKSMTRLLVFMAATTAIVMALIAEIACIHFMLVSTKEDPKEFPLLAVGSIITTLLLYAGVKKLVQKKTEAKEEIASD